jgi:hypothetical protein
MPFEEAVIAIWIEGVERIGGVERSETNFGGVERF